LIFVHFDEPIARRHDRDGFDCGQPLLNQYLSRYARQNHESGASKTFVSVETAGSAEILGFYSISPTSIEYERTPESIRRGLARHEVPLFRLGRLAVDLRFQGRGIGGDLLIRAAVRCMAAAEQVGGVALLVDAKDERSARWYTGYGGMPLADAPLSLIIPFASFRQALS